MHQRKPSFGVKIVLSVFVFFCAWPYWICIFKSLPFKRKIYGRRVLKWITQRHLLMFALVNLLVPLFNAQKKNVLNYFFACVVSRSPAPDEHWLCLFTTMLICTALGIFLWLIFKWDVASVFFNLHVVSKSPAEISTPISSVLELWSCANLHCLENMAHDCSNL